MIPQVNVTAQPQKIPSFIQAHPAATQPVVAKVQPEKPPREFPISRAFVKTAFVRAVQLFTLTVLVISGFYGASRVPYKEWTNYLEGVAKKYVPQNQETHVAKVENEKPVVAPSRVHPTAAETRPHDKPPFDAVAIQKTLSKMVMLDTSGAVERAAKARSFQRKYDAVSPDGKFWKETVPLGIKFAQLKGAVSECKIEKPEGAAGFWPLTSYDPPIKDFFPLKEGVYKGLSIYFGWVGGLASRQADHFEMRCGGDETFDLFFNKSSNTLFAYSKTLTLSAPTPLNAVEQVEVEMAKYCSGPVQAHKAVARDRRNGVVDVHVRYCQYKYMVIVAASDAVSSSQDGLAQVNLAYVSGKGWKEYLAAVEAGGGKRLPASTN
jgi:hypothetical protein